MGSFDSNVEGPVGFKPMVTLKGDPAGDPSGESCLTITNDLKLDSIIFFRFFRIQNIASTR
jgi:hypothetical protein